MKSIKFSSIRLVILHFIVHENLFSIGDAFQQRIGRAGNIIWNRNNNLQHSVANNYNNNHNGFDIPKPLAHHNGFMKKIRRKDIGRSSASRNAGGILWEDLNVVTQEGKQILHSSSGYIANGHVCGIIGPSGSGSEFNQFIRTVPAWRLVCRAIPAIKSNWHILSFCLWNSSCRVYFFVDNCLQAGSITECGWTRSSLLQQQQSQSWGQWR